MTTQFSIGQKVFTTTGRHRNYTAYVVEINDTTAKIRIPMVSGPRNSWNSYATVKVASLVAK